MFGLFYDIPTSTITFSWLLTIALVAITLTIDKLAAVEKGAPLPENEWPPSVETLKRQRPLLPQGALGRMSYLFIFVLIPLFLFILTLAFPVGGVEWQTGLSAYPRIMLGSFVNLIFSPFILYAIGAFLFIFFTGEQAAERLVVRMGIYTGFLLALHYTIMVAATGLFQFMFLLPVSAALIFIVGKYRKFWQSKHGRAMLLGSALVFVALIMVTRGIILGFIFLGGLLTAIFWVLPLASILSWRLVQRYEQPLLEVDADKGVFFLWCLGWFLTWQQAIAKALSLYDSLPTEPPDCYIATAASQGDPTVVGSQPVTCANGQVLWVNRQLQICKAAELALRTVAPRLHTPLRWLYDLLGRPLAQRINRPWLAHCMYWSLKPFEWLAYGLLRLFVSPDQILRLYR